MGETNRDKTRGVALAYAFSILERIDVGETESLSTTDHLEETPFSILERIDVGETLW
mgnify:CR=1 FL=1